MTASEKSLTIGKVAVLTGVSVDTLRYYEKMKLIHADARSRAGYRLYQADVLRGVRFIRGAKALNFTLAEIRSLLQLSTSDKSTCSEMVRQTQGKIAEAQTKILELTEIQNMLSALVEACPGDDTPADECPILDYIQQKE